MGQREQGWKTECFEVLLDRTVRSLPSQLSDRGDRVGV